MQMQINIDEWMCKWWILSAFAKAIDGRCVMQNFPDVLSAVGTLME